MLNHVSKGICWLLASCALSACAAMPTDEAYRGVLRLKGNAPFVRAVLEDSQGRFWTLKGVKPEFAQRLQNQRVRLQGSPAPQTPPGLPVLEVTQIEADTGP